jgi:hypothetical protein
MYEGSSALEVLGGCSRPKSIAKYKENSMGNLCKVKPAQVDYGEASHMVR